MASSVPPVPNYVHVEIRLIMTNNVNSLVCTTLLFHYGVMIDGFFVGGLVKPGETLMAGVIRHCCHLVNFRIEQIDRLYIAKVLDGFADHEPVKKSFFIIDILFNRLEWLARSHTPALFVAVDGNINEVVVVLEHLPGPNFSHRSSN